MARKSQIGQMNAEFALSFLQRERIQIVEKNVGGTSARRVSFKATDGLVTHVLVNEAAPEPVKPERRTPPPSVELF